MTVKSARYDFVGRLDGVKRTPQGGIEATATLTRVGVFTYPEGKELRPAEEVFHADSLATLKGAPLTLGHPSEVNPGNYRALNVGTVGDDVRADGNFVKATVRIQDKEACDGVESGKYSELSCGYTVDLEKRDGEFEGEAYQYVQHNPRYNHVAIGGVNWGRAGSDVRIHLDGERTSLDSMTTQVKRTDAPNTNENANEAEGLRKDLAASRADCDRLRAERDSANARADKAEARADAAEKSVNESKAKSDAAEAAFDARVSARVDLQTKASTVLPKEYVFKGKSDRQIRIDAIKKIDPNFDVKDAEGKERTDGYLEARFDLDCSKVVTENAALAATNEVATDAGTRTDAVVSPVEKARADMIERNRNAHKK